MNETVLQIHTTNFKSGIRKKPEFEKKRLAQFAVNVGTKCSHGCTYCSSAASLRMHQSFKQAGKSAFDDGYAIIDPNVPAKVSIDAKGKRNRGTVMLCTTVDGWCPAAQKYALGSKCLRAILAETEWTVRILTKNAAVVEDFPFIAEHKDRVQIGITITGTESKSNIISVIEPNASSVKERMNTLTG